MLDTADVNLNAAVRAANRRFYDLIAPVYDEVDRRRRATTPAWLGRTVASVHALLPASRRTSGRCTLLDAGAGRGFLAHSAAQVFDRTIAVDLSHPMLDRIRVARAMRVQGDCAAIPLGDASVDAVGALATLHHLYDPVSFFREAYRVLRAGGVLYTDHDIEAAFVARFRWPLAAYRALFDHGRGYLRRCPQATAQDYTLSEWHGAHGLDAGALRAALASVGFKHVTVRYHSEGLGAFGAAVAAARLGSVCDRRGWAPLVRIVAVKG